MQSSLYVSLSGQLALMNRLDTIAHNVANSETAGFRAEQVKFDEVLSGQTAPDATSFVSTGRTFISRQTGAMVQTENPYDVAVKGDAWLAIQTPAGVAYTRDGRFKMTPEGELQTLVGYSVLDVGGAPIQLNPNGGKPIISEDGTIIQGTTRAGVLGLFTIPEDAKLSRFENSGVIPDQGATPALDFNRAGVMQGFVEKSNVNPVMEISKLIMIQRAFDSITGAMTQTENTLQTAIKTLGETS